MTISFLSSYELELSDVVGDVAQLEHRFVGDVAQVELRFVVEVECLCDDAGGDVDAEDKLPATDSSIH